MNMSSNIQRGHLGNLLVEYYNMLPPQLVQSIPPMKDCWSGHTSRKLSDGARYAAKKKGEYYALTDEYHCKAVGRSSCVKYFKMKFWSDTSMYALLVGTPSLADILAPKNVCPTVSHRLYCAPLFLDFTRSDMTVSCVIHLLEWRRCGDNGDCEISPVKCTASENFTFTLFAQSYHNYCLVLSSNAPRKW